MNKLALAIATLVSLAVVGCSQQTNPVAPAAENITPIAPAAKVSDLTGLDNTTEPDYVKQPKSNAAKSIVTASAIATPAFGGKVDLKSRFYDPIGKKNVEISFNLKVPAGAVNEQVTITMTLDTTNLLSNITFEPHGTVFNKAAMFNATCVGLDLGNLRTGDVDMYYVVNGEWIERNVPQKVAINTKKGELVLKDVPMNHFSQYAFGRRR